ncbi:MAG: hypothetical protein HKL80_01420 [Acidimicrobiales bacterium]|nr:hypothetical protein [Acidimicrobiales bacterium]
MNVGKAPCDILATISLAISIVGGIYLSSYLPKRAPLLPAYVILGLALSISLINIVLLASLRDISWKIFFQVDKWAIVAELVIASILEFVFVYDGTRGVMLVIMSFLLFLFALNVATILSFTVAKYQS